MLRERDIKAAEYYGIRKEVESLASELMKVPGVSDIDIDADMYELKQLAILPKYAIKVSDPAYFIKRRHLAQAVIDIAKDHNMIRTEDPIEDYGEHLYIVFHAHGYIC